MRGKHGRPRPGRPDEPEIGVVAPGHHEPTPPAAPVMSAAQVYLPPQARSAPLPPSLPPIRSTPLPEYATSEVAAPEADAPELAAPEPVTPEPVIAEPVIAEAVIPEPVTPEPATPELDALELAALEPATPEPATPEPATPEPATPEPATPEPATPELRTEPIEIEELPPTPVVHATVPAHAVYATVPAHAVHARVPAHAAVPAHAVHATVPARVPAVPAAVPAHAVHAPVPAHAVRANAPASGGRATMTAPVEIVPKTLPGPADPILPGGRGIGRDDGDDDRSPRRRWVLAIVAGVALLSLVVYMLLPGSHAKTAAKPTPVPAGRSQSTMLIQFSGNLGSAIGSALVAHDTVENDGVVVLVPSDLITQVPGFGSMPFGQALTVGDPAAPRTALSDLVGVTVDSSWTLTPAAFAALVDKIGGVTIAVNRDVTKTVDGVTNILVPAGQQKLGGTAVVEYASFLADGETEQARLARFDSVLRQVLAALPRDPGTLSTQLASLGAGSSSSLTVTNLAAFLHNLAADNTQNALSDQLLPVIDLQAGGQQSSSTLDTAKTAALVKSQLASSVPTSRAVSSNRVYVQNQVGTPGLGESTRAKLQRAGYQYINGQNTPDMPNTQALSVVLIFGQTSAQIAEGQAVAAALGLPASDVKINSVGFTAADVIVKLGVDYAQ